MEIVGNNEFVVRQIERLRHVVKLLAPFQPAVLTASVAAWAFLAWVLWQRQFVVANWVTAVVAVLSVLALGVPRWVDALSAEANNHAKGLAGEQATANLLKKLLNSNWTLYQNVTLPDQLGDIDGILVGTSGVFLLEIKTYSGIYQNSGSKWLQKTPDQAWELVKKSPTHQVQKNVERLTGWLLEQDLPIVVQPRLVWAGDGLILQEEPDVSFWLLNQEQVIVDELRRGEAISAETIAQLNRCLKTRIETDNQHDLLPTAPILG